MSQRKRFSIGLGVGCVLLALPCVAAGAPQRSVMGQGEIIGNDVYVRSGPSLNHYTICKLAAGDRVTILGEQGAWYEITPPAIAFSLISGEYVDTADNKSGVVNGKNVRVRAGSLLNKSKYTVQTMLSKGAEVSILGSEPDGFLRIVPPDNATLWVNREYVELVPDELVKLERQASGDPGATAQTSPEGEPAATVKSDRAEADSDGESAFAALPPTEQREELDRIDLAAREQVKKPLFERRFDEVLKRYQAIAEQDEDDVARQYARLRIEQITRMNELAESVRKVRELAAKSEAKRRDALAGRLVLPDASVPEPSGLDAQGELRKSALYPHGSVPRRYRLVDPKAGGRMTIGYIEIPADSPIVVEDYLGRYVGVRASATRLQSGGVNPVPIYIARELVIVEPVVAAADQAGSQ